MRSRHFWMNLGAALLMTVCLLPTGVGAQSASRTEYQISAGDLDTALKAFAAQSHVQISYPPELVRGKTNSAVSGGYSPAEALRELLSGTGLVAEAVNASTFVLKRLSPPAAPKAKSITEITSSAADAELTQIIVTAQKQGEQNLKDVPMPIFVLNTDQLSDTSQVLLKDYASSVPGLNLLPGTNGIQYLSIRGITTGIANPVVGFMIDDVPYGAFSNQAEIPDIDPGDLARIEVLRGPQGTLYGDSGMGGLINYVTKQPSTDGFSGRFETGTDFIQNGTEPGYDFRASANVPITDQLAIRISGFERHDPGYIDNPLLNEKGVNRANAYGGKFALLWQVTPDTSVAFSALGQYTQQDGLSYIEPALGGMRQDYAQNSSYDNRSVQAYSLTLKTKFNGINVTSLTGYSVGVDNNSVDFSEDFLSSATLPGVASTPMYSHFVTEKISQEFRLDGNLFNNLDWLVGGFYTHEHSPGYQIAYQSDSAGNIIAPLGTLEEHQDFEEYAGFANLTYHFSSQFDIEVGGRESHYSVTSPINTYTGIFAEVNPATSGSSDVFTYLVTPEFKVSSDTMVYARFASGFRPGSPNTALVIQQGAPAQQAADQTKSYEVGLKSDLFDRKLFVDISAYYIDWSNIQLNLETSGTNGGAALFSYGANGGGAKSEGVDFSFTARPTSELTVSGWVAYDNAVLTQNFPPVPLANGTCAAPNGICGTAYGVTGNRLPFTPELSSSLSVDETFPLSNSATGFLGGQVEYVGDRIGIFEPTAQRRVYPSYTRTDLRAGVKDEAWTFSAYANNVGDVRGQLNGGPGSFVPRNGFIYITPRTVGLSIAKNF